MTNFRIFLVVFFGMFVLIRCQTSHRISGDQAFELKQYSVAIPLLIEKYDDEKNVIEKSVQAKKIAESYKRLQQNSNRLEWYQKAYLAVEDPNTLYEIGLSLKALERYQEAIEIFDRLSELAMYKTLCTRESRICVQALQWMAKPRPIKIVKAIFNTDVSDFAPAFYGEEGLVFTSESNLATGKKYYPWTGEKYSDIFYVDLANPNDIVPFDPIFNSINNDGALCFSKDFKTCYFTRCDATDSNGSAIHCRIMKTYNNEGYWEEPIALPFSLPGINYGQPTLLENDSILVFSANSEIGGSKDLYYVEILPDGEVSEPISMPSSINSKGNEVFPTSDHDTLYFSSDYLPGMGGFDIFKTYLRHDDTWSPPQNLKFPINSGADDFSLIVKPKSKVDDGVVRRGYFVSSRDELSKDDIYAFTELYESEQAKPKTEKGQDIFVAVKTKYTTIDAIGKTSISPLPLGNTQVEFRFSDPKKNASITTDERGFGFLEINEAGKVEIIATKRGFLTKVFDFAMDVPQANANDESYTFNIDVTLEKIEKDAEVLLKDIFYDFDKWDLKSESQTTLDELVKLMNNNPKLIIQINSYTDCRGTEAYNIDLSQKRAQSVVDYLTLHGIDISRLSALGKGETNAVENCVCENCTEAQHQKNRRTTFKILAY